MKNSSMQKEHKGDMHKSWQPVRFLSEHLQMLLKGTVLDVASGHGRNALYVAEHGFSVHALDRNPEALGVLSAAAAERKLSHVTTQVVDLESEELPATVFPPAAYENVLVFFYFFRPLFPALLRTLKPGGILMYETFLVENHIRYHHPRHRSFCLEPGELHTLTHGLDILHYDEGAREKGEEAAVMFTARLIGQKRRS